MSRVTLNPVRGKSSRKAWGRKDEEYIADFCLLSKRHLDDREYVVFKFHFLYGADWKLCCRKLNLDRGNFFHCVYRIQQKLGKAFRETKPYSLFPLDEDFQDSVKAAVTSRRLGGSPDRSSHPVNPPVRRAA